LPTQIPRAEKDTGFFALWGFVHVRATRKHVGENGQQGDDFGWKASSMWKENLKSLQYQKTDHTNATRTVENQLKEFKTSFLEFKERYVS